MQYQWETEGSAPTPSVHRLPDWQLHLLAILGYTLLSLVVTYPVVLHFTDRVVGEDPIDQAQNIWNLWWVKVALLDRHVSPFHTDMLFYPQGADLYFHTLNLPSTLLVQLPLFALGIQAAYNFSVLFALVLGAYAGFRLVASLTGSAPAALLSGVIIGFNALTLHVLQGQLNI